MKICEKHKTTPALIYRECVGCELEGLRADVKRLKAESNQILNDANACTMCIATKRGPARVGNDTIGDISAQYLKLEDGSGIGMNESDMYLAGYRAALQAVSETLEYQRRAYVDIVHHEEALVCSQIRGIVMDLAESV